MPKILNDEDNCKWKKVYWNSAWLIEDLIYKPKQVLLETQKAYRKMKLKEE